MNITSAFDSEFLKALEQYLGKGDYVSHSSALFLHGFLSTVDAVEIVSNRRHRNHEIAGIRLKFVYRKNHDEKDLSGIELLNGSLPVASPGLAWVDLLANLELAPKLEKLTELAQILPIEVEEVLGMAAKINATVFKRAAFLLGWCGRLRSFDGIQKLLEGSRSKLDHRLDMSEQILDRRFRLYFPAYLLSEPVFKVPSNKYGWKMLRNSRGFTNALNHEKSLILLEDDFECCSLNSLLFPSDSVDILQVEKWLTDVGLNDVADSVELCDVNAIGEWTRLLFVVPGSSDSFRAFVENEFADFDKHGKLVKGLLLAALAMRFAEAAVCIVNKYCETLYLHAGTSLLRLSFEQFGSKYDFNSHALAIIGILKASKGQRDEAREILNKVESQLDSSEGWYFFVKAVKAHRCNSDMTCGHYYQSAIERFECSGKRLLAETCRNSLGNMCLGLGKFAEAKEHYLRAWRNCRREKLMSDDFKALLVANIGFSDFYRGELMLAKKYLEKAVPLCRKTSYFSALALILYYLSLIELRLGNFATSLANIRSTWAMNKKHSMTRASPDTISLMIAVLQFMNMKEESDYLIQKLDLDDAVEEVIFHLSCCRANILSGEYEKALKAARTSEQCSRILAEKMPVNGYWHDQALVMLVLLSLLCETEIEKSIKESILKCDFSEPSLESFNGKVLQILVVDLNPSPELNQLLAGFCDKSYFEPLWFLIYGLISNLQLKNAARFLETQYHFSNTFLQTCARKKLVNLVSSGYFKKFAMPQPACYLFIDSLSMELVKEDVENFSSRLQGAGPFFFDGINGNIHMGNLKIPLKKGGLSERIIHKLLLAKGEPILAEELYETVWKTQYDEDFDFAALKTAVMRLRQMLQKHFFIEKMGLVTRDDKKYVEFILPEGWSAILNAF